MSLTLRCLVGANGMVAESMILLFRLEDGINAVVAMRVLALKSVEIFLGEATGAGAVTFLTKAPLKSGNLVVTGRLWGGV